MRIGQRAVAESQGEEGTGAAAAIGESGFGGGPCERRADDWTRQRNLLKPNETLFAQRHSQTNSGKPSVRQAGQSGAAHTLLVNASTRYGELLPTSKLHFIIPSMDPSPSISRFN
jgi:hypothetical protein